jgi:hypothetical protein
MLCVAHWQAKVKVLAVSLIDLHDQSTGIGVCEFACVPVALFVVCVSSAPAGLDRYLRLIIPDYFCEMSSVISENSL